MAGRLQPWHPGRLRKFLSSPGSALRQEEGVLGCVAGQTGWTGRGKYTFPMVGPIDNEVTRSNSKSAPTTFPARAAGQRKKLVLQAEATGRWRWQ